MRRILLITVLTTTAWAADNRVCWQRTAGEIAKCTDRMNQIAANAYMEELNREYPDTKHWVITEPTQVNWQRLQWIGTGVAVASAMYDVHTTQEVLGAGGVEKNFLYGSHPSAARLYGFSLGLVGGQALFSQLWRHRHPGNANTVEQVGFVANVGTALIHTLAGLHNEGILTQQKAINAGSGRE